jgi:hypothetical protein
MRNALWLVGAHPPRWWSNFEPILPWAPLTPLGRCASVLAIFGAMTILNAPGVGAQSGVPEIAYVEAVTGRVVISAQGRESELELLDTISAGAQLSLEKGAQLRICHYGLHELIALKGPLKGSVSRGGILAENGQSIASSGRGCTEPVVSTVQGGIAFRSAGGPPSARVPLRPSIKLLNTGGLQIRRAGLWDSNRERQVAAFDKSIARPSLEDGAVYQLVIEFANGTERILSLRASVDSVATAVIIMIR